MIAVLRYCFALFVLIFALLPAVSFADAAPQYINLQAVLVDDGGNVIHDKQEDDITFFVLDGAGEILYQEVQHVPIVNGAISVLIGRGNVPGTTTPTGGIPYDVFAPDGDIFLRLKLNDQTIPQEDLLVVSVPYAFYAEKLSSGVQSVDIVNGTINQEDLSETLLAFLDASISGISEADLLAHKTEEGAHPARSISVDNTFVNASGNDVQDVLQGVDTAISMDRNRIGEIEDVLPALGPGQTLDDIYVNVTGDTMSGTLNMGGNSIINATGNISQWTNDTGYITDGNVNWDNSYGYITAADLPDFSGWDQNVSDDLTMANFAGWDTDASNDLTTSTIFTGDVDGSYDSGTGTVDIQITETQPVPTSQRPFAYGTCNGSTEANGSNLGNCSVDVVTGLARQVYFSTPASDTNYVVQVTFSGGSIAGQTLGVCGKSTTRFLVCQFDYWGMQSYPNNFDFVVFKN